MVADERFKGQVEDPRFRLVPKKKRKVKIDERFKSLLDENSSFSRKAVVDKYGRKVKHESKEDLKRFYHMDEDENEDEMVAAEGSKSTGDVVEETKGGKKKVTKGKIKEEVGKNKMGSKSAKGSVHGDGAKPSDKSGKTKATLDISAKLQHKDIREAMLDWSESSSEDEDEDEDESLGMDEKLFSEALDVSQPVLPVTETIKAGEETRRLAVVNLDWKRVKAVDLLVLLRSFAPSNGEVYSVKVYPSEFGKERMEKEKREGPAQYLGARKDKQGDEDDSEDDSNDGDEEEIDMVKLRRYEAEKLKYFYAVAECDSARTAKCIYAMCDGVEYEASANVIDLRYIPDEEEFDEAEVHAVASSVPSDYVSPFFINNAMGHTKVKLSWDDDDPSRDVLHGKGMPGGKKKKKGKKEKEMQMIDYSQFIATSDEEEDEEESARREKAREALLGAAKSSASAFGKQGSEKSAEDVVVTFTPGLSSIGDQLLKNKQEREEESEMTVWDKYQKKRAEKKKEKRIKKTEKGDEEEELSESELPAGSEFVDDSVFENDPFFQLPDEDEDEDRGMWKKGKGMKGKGKNSQKQQEEEEEERKERERQQLELLMMDEANEGKRGYSIKHSALGRASQLAGEEVNKKKKKKGKKEKGDEDKGDSFKLDLNDPRFASVYSDPKFALDPTDPQFRKTAGLSKLMQEGQERRSKRSRSEEADHHGNGVPSQQQEKKSKLDPSITALVSTLKSRGKKL